jgi:hypothetical protein
MHGEDEEVEDVLLKRQKVLHLKLRSYSDVVSVSYGVVWA